MTQLKMPMTVLVSIQSFRHLLKAEAPAPDWNAGGIVLECRCPNMVVGKIHWTWCRDHGNQATFWTIKAPWYQQDFKSHPGFLRAFEYLFAGSTVEHWQLMTKCKLAGSRLLWTGIPLRDKNHSLLGRQAFLILKCYHLEVFEKYARYFTERAFILRTKRQF